MSFKKEISPILSRKVIAAAISSSIFPLLLGLLVPDPFNEGISSTGNYLQEAIQIVPLYFMYSFPVILVYGTITSIISDYLAHLISNYTNKKFKIYFSIILHIVFGIILLWYSLLAAFLFFITDYILVNKKIYKWNDALKSLGIPILVCIIFIFIVNIMPIIK